MTRMYLQYFTIFLKSFSMDFLPNGSDHFLLALVNAFFLLLYLNNYIERGFWIFGNVSMKTDKKEQKLSSKWTASDHLSGEFSFTSYPLIEIA